MDTDGQSNPKIENDANEAIEAVTDRAIAAPQPVDHAPGLAAAPTQMPVETTAAHQPAATPIMPVSEYIQPQVHPGQHGTAPTQPSYSQYPEYATSAQPTPTLQPQAQPHPQYYAPRQGVPPWAWIGGGLLLITIIVGIILTLVLVLGGNRGGTAGATNTPADATRNFYQRWGTRDYAGAYALIAPESQATVTTDQLKALMEQYEAQFGAFQSVTVSNNAEQGNNATNTAVIKFANGNEVTSNVRLTKVNNQWLVVSN